MVNNLRGTGSPTPGADADGDGYVSDQEGGDDCDDNDPTVNPGATETCDDGVDNDCDGTTDVGDDADSDGSDSCLDCDDDDINSFPGAAELCDEIDNDCNGSVDDNVAYVDWFPDSDEDGYGDETGTPVNDCAPVDGHATATGDCNDSEGTIHPNAVELCNGIDEDCDQVIPSDETDDDGDGFVECDWTGADTSLSGNDCDDGDATSNPGASEICDGIDNDCDSAIPADEQDGDSDGESSCAGDCNDADGTINSGATEVCDAIDSDCDNSIVDEFDDFDNDGDPDCNDTDDDNDGDPDSSDCDDFNATINSNAVDICDGEDWDCDGSLVDEFTNTDGDLEPDCFDTDDDNDGVADTSDSASLDPNVCGDSDSDSCEDCISGTSDPAADGADFDGDGLCDAGDPDDDNDSDPDSSDCAPTDAAIYNGNTEVCENGIDDDCDSMTTCVSVTQNGASQVISPYLGTETVSDWYSYQSPRNASSNTGLEVEDHLVEIIYQEPASEGGELFLTLLIDNNQGSNNTGNIDIQGTGFAGTSVVVADDATEAPSIASNGDFTGSWSWATCCNDGAVVGPLPVDFCLELTVQSGSSGISGITVYDGSTAVALSGAITDTVQICEAD